MSTTRRTLLKGLSALPAAGSLPLLAACDGANSTPGGGPAAPAPDPGNNPGADPGTDPGALDFDFPQVTPLPFAHGVASGDPLADRVILWTRVTRPQPDGEPVPVQWRIGTGFDDSGAQPQVTGVVAAGSQDAIAARDYTVKVDATGLAAGRSYYYQFSALGADSIIGRTRTAPDSMVESLRIAVVACSSYWSSWWSGYGHIANREDLDLVVHCGDYIYDFVDNDEEVRARLDRFDTNDVDYRDWTNLDEVRRRYALWRSDPNHLRAHQQHPWSIIWDNHDISVGYGNELAAPDLESTTTLEDVVQAFWEWTPSRPPRPDGSGEFLLVEDGSYPEAPRQPLLYRKLDYGPLADIFCLDTWSRTTGEVETDSSHLDGAPSKLGRPQFEWLTAGLSESAAAGKTWRLLVNQHWLAPIEPQLIPGDDSQLLGLSRWASYTQERDRLFAYLRGDNPAGSRIANNVVLSGDTHGNWASDLVESLSVASSYLSGLPILNPRSGSTLENQLAGFMRATSGNTALLNNRAQSVGVEFAPTSMGRGGADELIANANPLSTRADQVLGSRAIEQLVINADRNCQYIEWVDHGYGLVHLTAEAATFEYWWQDKLTPDSPDVLGQQMISYASDDPTALPSPRYRDQIDAVMVHGMMVSPTQGSRAAPLAPEGELNPR